MSYSNVDIRKIMAQFEREIHPSCNQNENENEDLSEKKMMNLDQSIYECPSCHYFGLFIDEGILLCRNCLCEYGGIIDDTAEWRNYSVDDHHMSDPARCGTFINPLMIESSYGTTLGYTRNNYFNHLKQLNNWQAMPYHERSLKLVFDRLTQNGFNNGLTLNIVEFSHKLFAEVSKIQSNIGETKLSRGDIRDGLISACLFYSCKEYEVSRSPQEIGKICNVRTSDVTRGINLFYELMKNSKSINLNKYITKYSDFIERYCNNLGIDPKIAIEIMILGKKVDELKILTKNTPQAMACGCIFFVTTMYNMGITKTNIAEKCGISVPTITKSYEKLLPYAHELV